MRCGVWMFCSINSTTTTLSHCHGLVSNFNALHHNLQLTVVITVSIYFNCFALYHLISACKFLPCIFLFVKSKIHSIALDVHVAGRSGLAATCLSMVWEIRVFDLTVGSFVFVMIATMIYSLWHRLHTFTSVPRLTQPSILSGSANDCQLLG